MARDEEEPHLAAGPVDLGRKHLAVRGRPAVVPAQIDRANHGTAPCSCAELTSRLLPRVSRPSTSTTAAPATMIAAMCQKTTRWLPALAMIQPIASGARMPPTRVSPVAQPLPRARMWVG